MDSDSDWTTTALFSPSKARVQQAQAKDWASVEAWLASKYGTKGRLPPFERNDETLQALLSLASFNECADEQQNLIERVEKASLNAMARRGDVEEKIFASLSLHLDQQTQNSLAAMAEASTNLGTAEPYRMAYEACRITTERFEAEERRRRVQVQLSVLRREIIRVRQLLEALEHESFAIPTDWLEQTNEWTRDTKHFKAKIAEYEERLSGLRAAPMPFPNIADVTTQAKDLIVLRAQVEGLDLKIAAFQNLPMDSRAARKKLESAREDLRGLVRERDELFERMADGQS